MTFRVVRCATLALAPSMPDPSASNATPAPAHAFHLTRWQERGLLGVLSAVQFSHIVDFMLIMPLGPQLMRLYGITPAEFGVLVSAYSFTAAIFGFINALFVDRMNRKTVLLAFFALFALATLACGLAPGYALLLIARSVAGAFGGSLNAIVQSIFGDVFPPHRRGMTTSVGPSAFAPVHSALTLLPEEFEARITQRDTIPVIAGAPT